MPTFCHAVVIEGSQSLFSGSAGGSLLANAFIASLVAFESSKSCLSRNSDRSVMPDGVSLPVHSTVSSPARTLARRGSEPGSLKR